MCLMSDEIMSGTQLILRAIEVIPGAFIRRSGRRWRKSTAFSSESSSPENSDLVLTSDQISLHLSGIEQEKMDQGCEDSVCKSSNKLISLEYLINQITNANYYEDTFYLEEKYNHIFNRFFKILKVDVDKSNQFAFVIFIKKDGSYDKDVWDNKSNSAEKCPEVYKPKGTKKHSEDDIFVLLKEILSKSNCPYKEALIFSLNSPCLARPENTSCMDQAIDIAEKLHEKHGMKTIIGFYKPWGINGPYEKILPYKLLNVYTYTFESQTFEINDRSVSSKKTENIREVDMELVDPIYNKVIPGAQNKPFLMNDSTRPKYDLQPFFEKIVNPKNKKKLKDIVLNLFRHEKNLHKTFDDFKKHGLEMFEKCMEEISDLLIDDYYDADLYDEIFRYLQNVFFPWWAKKVESASSKFLNEETSYFLQESAVCHFHTDIKNIEHYFVIGYVKKFPM